MFVNNLAYTVTEEDLLEAFGTLGEVGDVTVVRDDEGVNRGFGFVTMMDGEAGEACLEKLNGLEIKGRNISIKPPQSREEREEKRR
jgi:RNA recognition motif-containing protein